MEDGYTLPGLACPAGGSVTKVCSLVAVYYSKGWVTWNDRSGKINRFKYMWKKMRFKEHIGKQI